MPAPDALALMRSRYSAYALDLVDYIIDTTHPQCEQYSSNTAVWKEDLHGFCRSTRFVGLEIKDFSDGDSIAYVTFHARLHQGETNTSFTERSTFEKVDRRWLYKNGEVRSVTE
jgi:SEC-C motif-containing protein